MTAPALTTDAALRARAEEIKARILGNFNDAISDHFHSLIVDIALKLAAEVRASEREMVCERCGKPDAEEECSGQPGDLITRAAFEVGKGRGT